MLCKVCKDGLESIGTSTARCLYSWGHTASSQRLSTKDLTWDNLYKHFAVPSPPNSPSRGEDRRSIEDCCCVYDNHSFGHHRDEDSFARSARQGCVMCSDFPLYQDQDNERNETKEHGYFTIFKVAYEHNILCMTVDSDFGSKTIELLPAKTVWAPGNSLNFDLECSTNSPQTWSMIFTWMKTCSWFHDRCKSKDEGNKYRPTRLLEINYPKSVYSGSPPTFRLVSGDRCPQRSSYVTLSYRWGEKPLEQTLRLLKRTSSYLETSNPIDFLPKTFRDAIYIAHRFGIRYLWIDRLCIYQDSAEDWRKEAGTMQSVYRNASFCISALGAEDDEGGCFSARNPGLVAPTPVKLSGMKDVFRADLEDTAWRTAFQGEPLIQRGWVLQERLMSPRTIHFGRKQVFWECSEMHACETHPEGFGKFAPTIDSSPTKLVEQQDNTDFGLWKQLISTPIIPDTTTDPRTQLLANWSATMSLYSSTQLTIPSDKLVAVSGLAKDIRKGLQYIRSGHHRYLAGLWEEVLLETIVWYVRVGSPAHRAVNYRAPSWSWASLDGFIIIPDTFLEETTELSSVLSADMHFFGDDDTREVKSGTLTLYGLACLIEPGASSDNQHEVKAFRRFYDLQPIPCNRAEESWLSKPTVIFDTIQDFRTELFCIWIVAQPAALKGWQASGLALRCIGPNTYMRVGAISSYHPNQAELEEFVEAFTRTEVKII
ncbi:HET-domain-containing protein [Hypoxylon sp. FL0543]|nr:HET-domain-containing protein [Hypoxylon sp. FL0543]